MAVYDRWERLVESVLRREELRMIALRTPSDLSSSSAVTSRTPSDLSTSSAVTSRTPSNISTSSLMAPPLSLRIIAFDQIRKATADFANANKLGRLYKGKLEDGVPVVIKKTESPPNCVLEFELLSHSDHHRLVPLVGYCVRYGSEKYLVYKDMQYGDLSMYLDKGFVFSMVWRNDWRTRMKIAIGVAEGLSYLHHELVPSFIHGDIRASSVLLDVNFDVRLGSLANIRPRASQLHMFKRTLAPADDVYSYGKVLLELFGGKLQTYAAFCRMLPFVTNMTTKSKLMDKLRANDNERIYDNVFDLLNEDQLQLAEEWTVAIVVEACLENKAKPGTRPLMRDILGVLKNPPGILTVDPSVTVHPSYFMMEIKEFPLCVKRLLYPSGQPRR